MTNRFQQENSFDQPEQVMLCNLCGKKAQFLCSNCQDTGYCKPQHQKADWANHKRKCISLQQKKINHFSHKYKVRCEIFQLLSQKRIYEASEKCSQLLQIQKKFCDSNSCFQNEIEYGSTVVILARIWIYFKDFNKALDVLNGYLHHKMNFIKNTQNLPLTNKQLSSLSPKEITLVQGKISLISAIATVSHELVRNSLDIIQILIKHIQKIYGKHSLQLSNVYFYTGNYLNFLNQNNKALACFIKAAKLRGENQIESYYNAGILSLTSKNYSLALDLLSIALKKLQMYDSIENTEMQIKLYEALGVVYQKLNNYQKCISSFEKAICLHQNFKHQQPKEHIKLQKIMIVIKRQLEILQSEGKLFYNFPKEKASKKKIGQVTKTNYTNYWNADKSNDSQQRKKEKWLGSFNQFKKRTQVQSFIPQVPPIAMSLLGKQKEQVVRQEQVPSNTKKKDRNLYQQKVQVNLQFIQALTSIQIGFLDQLNRLVSQCRQRSAIIDIFQNSNLYQTLDDRKLKMLYQLNPHFRRSTDLVKRNINIIEQDFQGQQNFSRQYLLNMEKDKRKKKQKPTTPRLQLEKLKKN